MTTYDSTIEAALAQARAYRALAAAYDTKANAVEAQVQAMLAGCGPQPELEGETKAAQVGEVKRIHRSEACPVCGAGAAARKDHSTMGRGNARGMCSMCRTMIPYHDPPEEKETG